MSTIKSVYKNMRLDELTGGESSFFLSKINNKFLINLVLGKIDMINLAAKELTNRGLDKKGKFIGQDKSKEIWSKLK